MTTHVKIGAEAPRKDYVADGTQTAFPFDFAVFSAADLEVRVGGAVAVGGFAVGVDANGRGAVTFDVAPAGGTAIAVLRRLTVRRQTDFQEGGELRAKTLNDELDFQTAAIQQVAHGVARSLRQPDEDVAALAPLPPAATRAGQLLGFEAAGQAVARAETGGGSLALPLPIAQGGTGAATGAAARAALEAAPASASYAYLDAVQAFTRAQRYAPATLVDQAVIAWDLDVAPVARATLGGNRTLGAPANPRDGGVFLLIVQQDTAGGRALAWHATFDFGVDGTPALPAAPGKAAIFTFLSDGAAMRCIGRWSN
ncbi:MAG: hypothetical protein ACOVQI_12450 [Tagaea sp.]